MYDTIIVGAGMAGLTAAIYASRKRMNYKILATTFGGQFVTSGDILNYPGIVETTGVEFEETMQKQMQYNDVTITPETVTKIEPFGEGFKVTTDQNEYETYTAILASGARPRKLNVPGEKEYAKKGVTYCSICDGPLFTGKPVAIIGGGNSALEAVDFMADIASKIYVVNIGDKFMAHEYLIEKLDNTPNAEAILSAETVEVFGSDFVQGIKYVQGGKEKTLEVEGVIVEAGRVPNTERFSDLVELDSDGHIMIDCQSRTSRDGVYAAGDCTDGHEYQYVISAGQGCMALLKVARYLVKKKQKRL